MHSYDEKYQETTREILNEIERGAFSNETAWIRNLLKRDMWRMIPSTDDLYWDKEENKFKVNGFAFNLEEMMDYYKYPSLTINPLNPPLGATVVGAPVHITELKVERLTCYAEDSRD